MTIIAGFSSSRQGSAPLNLAAQLAHTTGEKIVAAAIVERALPAGIDPIDDEYHEYISSHAMAALQRAVVALPGDPDISVMVHSSTSIPQGMTELVDQHDASLVVVGSSSSGLLGRVALGSVTESLVHSAVVPVVLAPRGYPASPVPIQRLTAAYGGAAAAAGLIQTVADLAKRWSVRMRIASFTARPATMFGGSIERSAEDLVVRQWTRKTTDGVVKQLNEARTAVAIPDLDVVVGVGADWDDAVAGITWGSGELLVLGSRAAGPMAHVFLGSAASKILRHSPVPVMIVPKRHV